MSPTFKSLGIDRLTIDERIVLAHEIWDSIAEEPHPPLISEELKQELKRRIAEHEANPDDVVPWEQVKAELYARLRR